MKGIVSADALQTGWKILLVKTGGSGLFTTFSSWKISPPVRKRHRDDAEQIAYVLDIAQPRGTTVAPWV